MNKAYIFIIFIHLYIYIYSHSLWTYVVCILSPDYYHGCSWIEMYCFCLRPLILHHINFAKILENSTVTHLKSTQDTRVTSVTLLWRTLTWSVVEGKLCPVCFCLEVLWSALSICSCCYLSKLEFGTKLNHFLIHNHVRHHKPGDASGRSQIVKMLGPYGS